MVKTSGSLLMSQSPLATQFQLISLNQRSQDKGGQEGYLGVGWYDTYGNSWTYQRYQNGYNHKYSHLHPLSDASIFF